MITPINFLRSQMSQLPVSMQVTAPSALNFSTPMYAAKPDEEEQTTTNPKPTGDDSDTSNTGDFGKDDSYQDLNERFLEKYLDPEFRKGLMADKLAMSRAEMKDAYAMDKITGIPNTVKAGYQEAGNLIGQGGANIANIIGATNVPIGDLTPGGMPQLRDRQYFR